MDGIYKAGANSEAAHCPADPNDDQVIETGAEQAEEQEDGGQQNKEPVTEKPTHTTAEKGTVDHPDSTERSNFEDPAGEPVREGNSNPEQGQGDNGTTTPAECSEGGTNGEVPPEGDTSSGPADPNNDRVGETGAEQAEEQEDGGQQNKEPVTEKSTHTTAEKEGGTNGEVPPEGDNSSGPADPNDGHGDGRGAAQTKEQEDEVQQGGEPVTGTAENTTAEKEEATTDASDPEGPQEDVGPAADETDSEPIVVDVAVNRSGNTTYLLLSVVLVGLFAIWLVPDPIQPPAEQQASPRVDLFIREMTALETRFPSQRPDLWKRSRIHLERHLRNARPTEPVSLILVAGRRAERTLDCLARGLATAFSAAHNASVLHIDGSAAAGRDSDRVKMDIDSELQGAFGGDGDRPAAVIHRLEELPPGATLIFYRYCDHENAAYKKTFLLFTVLLDEPEVEAGLRLTAVEELVDEQLQRKFISPGLSVAFDSMDRDKYSGLWSRISHLILPVAAQPAVEGEGC